MSSLNSKVPADARAKRWMTGERALVALVALFVAVTVVGWIVLGPGSCDYAPWPESGPIFATLMGVVAVGSFAILRAMGWRGWWTFAAVAVSGGLALAILFALFFPGLACIGA